MNTLRELTCRSTEWHIFTGNQLGVLFASHILSTFTSPPTDLAMLCSAVSTQMLSSMAAHEGFHFTETLTGFKWLGNISQQLSTSPHNLKALYAFEEAIGFMFSTVVSDKDGIAALAVFLTLLHNLSKEGLTPYTKLQYMYEKYG